MGNQMMEARPVCLLLELDQTTEEGEFSSYWAYHHGPIIHREPVVSILMQISPVRFSEDIKTMKSKE